MTCKFVKVNDLLYLGGFFGHPVVSFPQFSNTVCCSVGINIFQFNATFNINQVDYFETSWPRPIGHENRPIFVMSLSGVKWQICKLKHLNVK